jgi:hypothetical protein
LTGEVRPFWDPPWRIDRRLSITAVLVRRQDDQADKRERKGVMTMMLYDMSQQYQAERIKSAAERRRADAELGMMAADVSRLWRRVTRPLRALGGFRTSSSTVSGCEAR